MLSIMGNLYDPSLYHVVLSRVYSPWTPFVSPSAIARRGAFSGEGQNHSADGDQRSSADLEGSEMLT